MKIGLAKWRLLIALVICGYVAVFASGFTLGKKAAVKDHKATFVSGSQREVLKNGIYILAGSFARRRKAVELVNRLKENGYRALLMDRTREIPLYRVFVGPVEEEKVKDILLSLQRQEKIIGYKVSDARY